MSKTDSKDLNLKLAGCAPLPADHFSIEDEGRRRHFVREGDGYKEVSDAVKQVKHVISLKTWTTNSLADFCAMVRKYAKPEAAHIFYSEGSEDVICFTNHEDRREFIRLDLKRSMEWAAFMNIGRNGIKQKALIELFETFPDVLGNNTMLAATLTNIVLKKDTEIKSNVDRDNIALSYTVAGGAQTATIPRTVTLKMPVFEGLDILDVLFRLDIKDDVPTGGTGITFDFVCPTAPRILREALRLFKSRLVAELPAPWFIAEGSAQDED